jgi:hypothetical protein
MRFEIHLLLAVVVFLGSDFLHAQNVNDDAAQYTPIPGPLVKEKKSAADEILETSSKDHKFAYFLFLQSGTLVGCSQCENAADVSFTTSVVNGVTIAKKFRVGVGLGFDTYSSWQALPVYASLGYDVFGNKNRNAFFIQMNYGYSKAWFLDSFPGDNLQKADGGRMFSPQIGYRLKYHNLNLSFGTGVKFQRVFSEYDTPIWTWFNGDTRPSTNRSTIRQDMTRIMIVMAVGL